MNLKKIPRRCAKAALFKVRLLTAKARALPDFIIAGAQKSGTTSLFAYLSQHPLLHPSSIKEVHYFDGGLTPEIDTYQLGVNWYRAHFPLQRNVLSNHQVFEASPLYQLNPLVPERISQLLPNAKLIFVLRNPVERAISHYFHELRKGQEDLPIEEALRNEEARIQSVVEANDFKSQTFMSHTYKTRGIYAEQLSRYFEWFSRDNCLVLNSKQLFEQPKETLKRVFEFVETDADFQVPSLQPRNVASNRKQVDSEVYDYLADYFAPRNKKLYELLAQDFGW